MKIFFTFLILVLLVCWTSCETTNEFDEDFILSYWMIEQDSEVGESVLDSVLLFNRVSALDFNSYGFAFLKEGHFIERKNIGWCGTPPISYGNFQGEWTMKGNKINLVSDYWGTKVIGERIHQEWELVSISENQMTIKRLYFELKK